MRSADATLMAAFGSNLGTNVVLVELAFDSGTERYATAPHDVPWNGQTWEGLGDVIRFQNLQESADRRAQSVKVVFTNVRQTVASLILNQEAVGRAANIYLAKIDGDGQVMGAVNIFPGLMNEPWEGKGDRDREKKAAEVSTKFVSRLARLEGESGFRTNTTSYRAATGFTDDTFFDTVAATEGKRPNWGGQVPPEAPA